MNGAGNAFIMVDARAIGGALAPSDDDVRALASLHPFDQLIALEHDPSGADARIRFWNCEGPEVGACGNGTRAAAWLMFQDGLRYSLTLSSQGGPMRARRFDGEAVEVDLGPARLDWQDIPLREPKDTVAMDFDPAIAGFDALSGPGAVNMGNPHCVFFVENVDALDLDRIGPLIEHHPLFPEQVNAGFAEVRSEAEIRLRVWERGAGLTLACGTGAAAALVAAHRQGRTGREAVIKADGGDLPVRWDDHGHVHLSGPVQMEGDLVLNDRLSRVFGA